MDGWIALQRKILEWEWYDDANTFRLFVHLNLCANHTEKKWRGITVKRGQVIVGRKQLAQDLKLSEQKIRTSIDKLILTGEITTKATNKHTLVTLVNYSAEQENSICKQPTNNQQSTGIITEVKPTNNQQITTNNNDNNIFSCFCSSIHEDPDDTIIKGLETWVEFFDYDVVKLAIDKAVKANVKTYRYIEGILNNWQSHNLKSVDAILESEKPRTDIKVQSIKKSKRSIKNNRFNNHEQRTYDHDFLAVKIVEQLESETSEAMA